MEPSPPSLHFFIEPKALARIFVFVLFLLKNMSIKIVCASLFFGRNWCDTVLEQLNMCLGV